MRGCRRAAVNGCYQVAQFDLEASSGFPCPLVCHLLRSRQAVCVPIIVHAG